MEINTYVLELGHVPNVTVEDTHVLKNSHDSIEDKM